MEFHIYQDRRGEWRWRAVAVNGRIVADCAEGYTREASAKRAAERFIDTIKESDPGVYTTEDLDGDRD